MRTDAWWFWAQRTGQDHTVNEQLALQGAIDGARDKARSDPKRRTMWLMLAAAMVAILGYPY